MSFLEDLLESDESLAVGTVNNDPTVRELVEKAAQAGNVSALRAAIQRGQIDASAPEDLVLRIVGVAGNQRDRMGAKEVQERTQFVQEWVNSTLPAGVGVRQARLDRLLQACYSGFFHVHDAVAEQLLKMGSNPMALYTGLLSPGSTRADIEALAVNGAAQSTPVSEETPRHVAIIGTAGRDKAKPMTAETWRLMLEDARQRVKPSDTLVSGGAAWADHVAVAMFLEGRVKALKLHLPAPLGTGQFEGPNESAASAGNYYHSLFKKAAGVDGIAEIRAALVKGAEHTSQPIAKGYGAMFARNKLVAEASDAVIAYTFGAGDEPADGGTKNTWDQIKTGRVHVPLDGLKAGAVLLPTGKPVAASSPAVSDQQRRHGVLVNQPGQPMAGARLGMTQVEGTTVSQAMYSGSQLTEKLLKLVPLQDAHENRSQIGSDRTQTGNIPAFKTVAKLNRDGIVVDVNAAAYAIAIAEPKQLDRVLAGLAQSKLPQDAVQAGLGESLSQVLRLRLHDFGADEVHHGIVKLLAAGARVDDVVSFSKTPVIVTDSPCLKFFDAEGRVIDGEKAIDGEVHSKLQRVTLPVALLSAPNSRQVAQVLTVLNFAGWNPDFPVTLPMDGSDGKATIAHFAALKGNEQIIAALQAAGADFEAVDAMGRKPVVYALAGLNPQSAELIDPTVELPVEPAEQKVRRGAKGPASSGPDGSAAEFVEAPHAQEVHDVARLPAAYGATAGAAPQADAPIKPASAQNASPSSSTTPSAAAPKAVNQRPAARVSDLDDINARLSEAAEHDRDELPGLAPLTAATTASTAPTAPVSRSAMMFNNMRQRQQQARDTVGKPLGQEPDAATLAAVQAATHSEIEPPVTAPQALAPEAARSVERAQAASEVIPSQPATGSVRALFARRPRP